MELRPSLLAQIYLYNKISFTFGVLQDVSRELWMIADFEIEGDRPTGLISRRSS